MQQIVHLFQTQALPHLSLLVSKRQISTDLIHQLKDCFAQILQVKDLENCAYYLELRNEKNSNYKLEDIKPLAQFLQTPAPHNAAKICFIWDADLLSTISSNKLLKIFEEASENIFIFLHTSNPSQILPTIQSRAITLHLKEMSKQEYEPRSLDDFWSFIQMEKTDEVNYLSSALIQEEGNKNYLQKKSWLAYLKWAEESRKFQLSSKERLYHLYQLWKNSKQ